MKDSMNKQQQKQMKLLSEFSKEEHEEYIQLLRFANTAIIYHEQANEFNPTETDFKEWLTGLPKDIRINMEIIGFDWCKEVISFKRYVLEKNDIGMDHWMQQNLTEDDYMEYREIFEQ